MEFKTAYSFPSPKSSPALLLLQVFIYPSCRLHANVNLLQISLKRGASLRPAEPLRSLGRACAYARVAEQLRVLRCVPAAPHAS